MCDMAWLSFGAAQMTFCVRSWWWNALLVIFIVLIHSIAHHIWRLKLRKSIALVWDRLMKKRETGRDFTRGFLPRKWGDAGSGIWARALLVPRSIIPSMQIDKQPRHCTKTDVVRPRLIFNYSQDQVASPPPSETVPLITMANLLTHFTSLVKSMR